MKKLLAIVLTLALCMGLVVLPASAEEVAKPEKITIFVDGTVFTESNAQDKFIERWEELSGIELEIIQPDHDAYYDVLQQQIASGEWPDVMILSSTYYAAYASEGVLWDMTDAWENSATKNSGRFTGDDVIEGLKDWRTAVRLCGCPWRRLRYLCKEGLAGCRGHGSSHHLG